MESSVPEPVCSVKFVSGPPSGTRPSIRLSACHLLCIHVCVCARRSIISVTTTYCFFFVPDTRQYVHLHSPLTVCVQRDGRRIGYLGFDDISQLPPRIGISLAPTSCSHSFGCFSFSTHTHPLISLCLPSPLFFSFRCSRYATADRASTATP